MFEKYINIARDMGVDDVLIISPEEISIAPWVRVRCQYGCSEYGKRRGCPPYSPTPEETQRILGSYGKALLLHKHWIRGYEVVNDFNRAVVSTKRTLFLDNYYKAFGMGSGPAICVRLVTWKNPVSTPQRLGHPWKAVV